MYDYALRIQNLPGYDEIIQDIFRDDRYTRTIRIHHMGKKRDNPHWHLLVTCDYDNRRNLANELKKHLTLNKGNKHLSVKVWDKNKKAMGYLFHEDTRPDMIRGFSEEEIKDAEELNRITQERIKSNAPAKIVQDAIQHFLVNEITAPTNRDIFDFVYDRLRASGDWLPNKFQFDRWALRIQASVRPQDEWRNLKQNLYESWYGNFSYM